MAGRRNADLGAVSFSFFCLTHSTEAAVAARLLLLIKKVKTQIVAQ